MAGDEKSQTLERLAKLALEDQPSTEGHGTSDGNVQSSSLPMHGKPITHHNKQPEDDRVDMAIKQALEDSKERATVLSIEEQVEKFILDTKQQSLEFPSTFTNYQRMLAHRIAQHYGLQTSTVDYEDGPGRVIARRTPWCRQPPLKVKLADLKPTSFRGAGGVPSKIMVRRPPSDESNFRAGAAVASTSQPNAHALAKDREEDYNQARERIVGKSMDVNMRAMNGRGRGGYMGRGAGAYSTTPRSPGGRGTRKAVFRDRDKELQDPDYRRGVSRYPGKPDSDTRSDSQLGYHAAFRTEMSRPSTSSSTGPPKSASPIPTSPARSFSSDYNGWNPKGYRPPPPPPMNPPGPHSKSYHHHHHPVAQHPNLAMPRPYTPYAMAPYPMPAMGMAYHPGLAGAVGPAAAAHAYMQPFGHFPFHQYQMMAPGPDGMHMAAPYQYYTPYAQHAYPTHYAPMPAALPHPNMNSEKMGNASAKSHNSTSNSSAKPTPSPQNNGSNQAEAADKK